MEKPKARRHGRRSSAATGSCLRASRGTMALLRLLRFTLALYVALMILSQYTLESGVGQMPVFSIKSKAVSATHRLKLKSRRRNEGSMCRSGFGSEDDPYFVPYGGVFCGTSLYEARPSGSPDHQVRRVTLTYKTFQTDKLAQDYFWRFWGIHSHSIMAPSLMIDVTSNVGNQGDVGHEHHTLYYNPSLLVSPSEEDVYAMAHMIHFFRQGNSIIMFDVSGFHNVPSPNINPELIKSLSAVVVEGVRVPDPLETVIRKSALKSLRFGRQIDRRIVQAVRELREMTSDFTADVYNEVLNTKIGTDTIPLFNSPNDDMHNTIEGIEENAFNDPNDTTTHDIDMDDIEIGGVDNSFHPDESHFLRAWTDGVQIPVAQGWNETRESVTTSEMPISHEGVEGITVIQPQADTAVSTKARRHTVLPVYFGEDKDLSKELDYQGDFVLDADMQSVVGSRQFVVFDKLNEFLLVLPFSDLSSSATMIALVLVLLGAGELIDPLKPIAAAA